MRGNRRKRASWWVNRTRRAFTQGTIKQIRLDLLRTAGAYTVYRVVLGAVYRAVPAVCHTAAHSQQIKALAPRGPLLAPSQPPGGRC